ncbi:hypothetical protein BX600DRAFT_510636 [Xylariales sp. PMI_506]|nr:hypothetical protein BX600DRAFT_510636 [Xylariales sp. PMI_506]
MCEKHYYSTEVNGEARKQTRIEECERARRRGQPCENPTKYRHPKNEVPPPRRQGTHIAVGGLPPSPPLSDSSFPYSGSEAERSHKRRSGVYINGEKVVDIHRRSSRRERRNSNHVVIVEPPASPRTPPRYETPYGSPSRSPTYEYESRARVYTSHSRPEVRLEVNDGRSSRHDNPVYYRHTSAPRSQSLARNADEEARTRRLERDLKKAEEAARRQRLQSEINRANEDIAKRPAVPPAPQPLNARYRRGSVSVKQPNDVLADMMRSMRIQETAVADAEKERRRRERRTEEAHKRDEAEAQRQRLLARMAPPQRSNTTGHSSARPKVVYDETFYR